MAFRLKPCALFLDKLYGDDTDKIPRNTSADSIASVIFPWRTAHQRRPALVIGSQAGREVGPVGFFLCMGSVMLLSTGIGICAATVWATVFKIPYMYILHGAVPLRISIFGFCAGILSLPCFWIAWTSHDSTKNYAFLPLLMVLLGFCLIMLTISTSMGFVYKSQMSFNMSLQPPQILPGQHQKLIHETMFTSMSLYDHNSGYRSAWDKVQRRLKCCGTTSSTDWTNITKEIPLSCCLTSTCKDNELYTRGCLDLVAFDLLWETCLISGLSLIVMAVQLFTLSIASYMYIKGRLAERKTPVVLHISNSD